MDLWRGRLDAQPRRARAPLEPRLDQGADRAEIRARYKAVGDFFGMDTDKFEREGEKERAAQQKALDQRNAEVLKNNLKREPGQ